MKHRFFDITPKIVHADKDQTVTVRNKLDKNDFIELKKRGTLCIEYVGADGLLLNSKIPAWGEFSHVEELHVDENTGDLSFTMHFRGEGEHTLRLIFVDKHGPSCLIDMKIFSLKPDLYDLRPFRGDMHMHSRYSGCGDRRESPAYMAAFCRRAGLDYIAITDHRQYKGSIEAIESLKDFSTDFKAYPGEEVHLPDLHNLHFVNFGGNACVSESIDNNIESFREDIAKRMKHIPKHKDERIGYLMAASDWCFDKIHEFGGMAIFCHPHWRPIERFFLPEEVKEYILRQGRFDAMEIVGHGKTDRQTREMNALSIAWWQRACTSAGKMIPVVGDTDSHNCQASIGHNGTIVFAKSCEFEDIVAAVRKGHSIAGEFIHGEFPHLFGDFRLVMFAHFLLREYFPEHDEICEAEGALMLDAVLGNSESGKIQKKFKGRIPELFKKYWA